MEGISILVRDRRGDYGRDVRILARIVAMCKKLEEKAVARRNGKKGVGRKRMAMESH